MPSSRWCTRSGRMGNARSALGRCGWRLRCVVPQTRVHADDSARVLVSAQQHGTLCAAVVRDGAQHRAVGLERSRACGHHHVAERNGIKRCVSLVDAHAVATVRTALGMRDGPVHRGITRGRARRRASTATPQQAQQRRCVQVSSRSARLALRSASVAGTREFSSTTLRCSSVSLVCAVVSPKMSRSASPIGSRYFVM